MTQPDDFQRAIRRNNELRAELHSASRRTEHLVNASEELLVKRERITASLKKLAVKAQISPDLGVVTVTADHRIIINLNQAKVAVSDTSKLGERILDALSRAETKLAEALAKVFDETTASHISR
ncbi:hypothetical protein GCM10023195_85120 [Actinoallomurus liliacearum]|uniref:YbaB/EbfC DNA-binding family protein n=1 Tax=Actinoallomurus liliacearum TaxID=1080073 RepID=A0ABP8TZC6_9ACTN